MAKLSSLILADKEFSAFAEYLKSALKKSDPLPAAISGLSGGAAHSFLAEAIRLARDTSPSLVLVGSEDEAADVTRTLSGYGIRAVRSKRSEFIFDSTSASHDTERE